MKVGDLVRNKTEKEHGLITKVLTGLPPVGGVDTVYEVLVIGKLNRPLWVASEMELISERR